MKFSRIKLAFITSVLLCTLACSIGSVLNSLQAVVAASEVAIAALQGSGAVTVPPAILAYLSAVSDATACASSELSATDPPAVQASKITGCFSQAIVPVLPPGTPQTVVAAIAAVAKEVAVFLNNFVGHASHQMTAKLPAPAFSSSQKAHLAEIAKRNAAVKAKLATLSKGK